MQYVIETSQPAQPRVQSIIDFRPMSEWLESDLVSLDSHVAYINEYGELLGMEDMGYEVATSGGDCLLATLEDGTRVVSSLSGMRVYMRATSQAFPSDLR